MNSNYSDSIKFEVIDSYSIGDSVKTIGEDLGISKEEVLNVLLSYKEESRFKKTFTDEFKIMIANRDISGAKRNSIASDLKLNIHTVRKACEQFGERLKDSPIQSDMSTIVEGVSDLSSCPTCKSKDVNSIDSILENVNTKGIYCKDCGDEHFKYQGEVHRVNWEFVN